MKNKELMLPVLAMFVVTAASNYLVEIPINSWLTYGAFSYPFSFLITELTNNAWGPQKARQVVYISFMFALIISFSFMNAQIAFASSIAFLVGQLLDITIFNQLRQQSWWVAPATASIVASLIDTIIFFSLAFYGTPLSWVTLACGDFMVKLLVDLAMLLPFRLAIRSRWQTQLAFG